MTTPEIAPTLSPALSGSTSSVEPENTLGTEVFDAEVAARVAVMRAELARTEEAMRTSVKIDLAKVCDALFVFLHAFRFTFVCNSYHAKSAK